MAEYFPLISRAVAGLRAGKPEARQAIYDRARQALVGQLRAMDPPVPEDAIARETAALDDAIARTEAEIAGADGSATSAPSTAQDAGSKPSRPASNDGGSKVPRPAPAFAPSLGGAKRDEEPRIETEVPARPQAPQSLLRQPIPPRPAVRPSDGEQPIVKPQLEPATGVATENGRTELSSQGPQQTLPLPVAPVLRVEPIDDGVDEQGEAEGQAISADDQTDDVRDDLATDRTRDGGARPMAPRPKEEKRSHLRIWIVAVAALAAVIAIAVTAWRLRDNPQELTRSAGSAPAQAVPDKIVERADSDGSGGTPDAASAPVATDEATRTTKDAAPAPATSGPGMQQAANAPSAPTSAQTDALLPIAYKAAILIDAPDTPEKVKTYVGTVVWHAQNVATGQGQPISLAIQADVSIPDTNTQLSMQIRRNTEPQLPASHTIDLKFTIGAGSPIGSIKQVSVPQMRQHDMPTGDPLAGIPVTIADNYFLIGLMRGAAEDRNLELLRSRPWIDIPLLLANGKASKITFEKGANGERIFNDVLNSWKTAQN